MAMDPETQVWVDKLIERIAYLEKTVDSLQAQVTELQNEVPEHQHGDLQDALDRKAYFEHYHDEKASVSHVERSEHQFREDIRNLEYRISDVERTAQDALTTARNAIGGGRGYY